MRNDGITMNLSVYYMQYATSSKFQELKPFSKFIYFEFINEWNYYNTIEFMMKQGNVTWKAAFFVHYSWVSNKILMKMMKSFICWLCMKTSFNCSGEGRKVKCEQYNNFLIIIIIIIISGISMDTGYKTQGTYKSSSSIWIVKNI